MSRKRVDTDNLTVTGAHENLKAPSVRVQKENDDVVIIVTQAYGPKGHRLVGISDASFDGYPAITLGVRTDEREGLVHLSPIHGDARKKGLTDLDIPVGTRCELFCPECKAPLDFVGEAEDESGARYYAVYLTPKLSKGAMVMISDVWGHYHSRIIDDMELISYWAATHDAADA